MLSSAAGPRLGRPGSYTQHDPRSGSDPESPACVLVGLRRRSAGAVLRHRLATFDPLRVGPPLRSCGGQCSGIRPGGSWKRTAVAIDAREAIPAALIVAPSAHHAAQDAAGLGRYSEGAPPQQRRGHQEYSR